MDINNLQNTVLDQEKLASLTKQTSKDYLKQLLTIKDSQVANLQSGKRGPSTNGLLRLMLLYGLEARDIVTIPE